MKFKKILLLSAIFTSVFYSANAQISEGGTPYSFINKTKETVTPAKMQAFDVNAMLAEDKENENKNIPYRFGKTFDVNYTPENSGTYEVLSNGDKLWRLRIISENAYSIGVIFGKYHLPEGAKLFIYSSDKKQVEGAFTYKNNKSYEKLAVTQVQSGKIIVEYYEPKEVEFKGKIQIGKIIHDYKNEINVNKETQIGDCHVNVACGQGIGWENEINSVCKMLFLGYACSGAMINNAQNNGRPYFLTARHCVHTVEAAEAMVFIFNYQSEYCWRNFGKSSDKTSGSRIIASPKNNEYDFTLLEMEEYPPESYNPYFAGWNNQEEAADSTTGIHHPGGEIKKISKDYDPPLTASVQAVGFAFEALGHWKMFEVDTGFF